VLEPILARYERSGVRRYFRADAAFASPEIYEYLEEHGFLYAIRLPSNQVLAKEIEPLLKRPVGRPPEKPSSGIMTSSTKRRAGTLPGG
jgi:hypothetical protein